MEHQFTPTHYFTTLGPHEPVLTVQPGDSIVTTTVDARGRDANRVQVTPRGNPQTGPFFVDGAEPDRKSTRPNFSHSEITYAVICWQNNISYSIYCLQKIKYSHLHN